MLVMLGQPLDGLVVSRCGQRLEHGAGAFTIPLPLPQTCQHQPIFDMESWKMRLEQGKCPSGISVSQPSARHAAHIAGPSRPARLHFGEHRQQRGQREQIL
ncbi:MAG: hypothetical protein D6720_11315, partial [Gammaproteobacteria bacterium]